MKQLVFVHGGETFDTYKEYVDALRRWEYEPDVLRIERWKDTLPEALGNDWRVLMPSMPSKYNAKYLEWCIWFDKVVPHLNDGVVLVGHSLGGLFLAKYLEEGSVPVTIAATFLLAAPHSDVALGEPLADFTLPPRLDHFASQAGSIFLYHSEDDPVVPFTALAAYQTHLPQAQVRVFTDRGHFLTPTFPELVEDIRSFS